MCAARQEGARTSWAQECRLAEQQAAAAAAAAEAEW